MELPTKFENVIKSVEDFEIYDKEKQTCEHANEFIEWSEWLFEDIVGENPDLKKIMQAKVLLQDQWHYWRRVVPRKCREHFSNRGRVCINQLYLEAYNRLQKAQLEIRPTLDFLPKAQSLYTSPEETIEPLIGLQAKE